MKTMNWLPTGSVVKIFGIESEILIIARGFVLPSQTEFVYFDYYGINTDVEIQKSTTFLLNSEDVTEVLFTGWTSTKQEQNEQRFIQNVVQKGQVKKAKKSIETQLQRTGF